MSALPLPLPVAFRDVRASDLSLSFEPVPYPPLRSLAVQLGAVSVELRVLGASHQVLVSAGGGLAAAETVASGLDGPALPPRADWSGGGWSLRFSSRVRSLGPVSFHAVVNRLRRVLAFEPHAIVGVFPGHQLAMTGLRAWSLPASVGWRTWHAYPQTRELVVTSSRVRVEAAR